MKETILRTLRQGNQVSGEELGKKLGISRTAVWKHIKELRSEGYQIDSSPRKGYSLVSAPDHLLPEEIRSGLGTSLLGRQIIYHREVTSTQEIAKALASQGADEGTVIIAENQTAGRGRIERVWVSPPGGVYISVILRPSIKPSEALRLPLIIGVAAALAIEKLVAIKPKLKWPNDIIIERKKVGGILTEISAEMDRVNYIVIGVGINVNTPQSSFPDEIKGIATSLRETRGREISRLKLVQSFLTELESLYQDFKISGFEPVRQKWKAFSNTIGAWVSISSSAGQTEGKAIDIDQDGVLILQKEDGTLERIFAGDVSLKNLEGV